MSSNNKTTDTIEDGKPALVPKLRFPEFREAEGWKTKKLSTLVHLVSGMHLSTEQYGKEGEVPYFTGPSDFTNETEAVTKRTSDSTSLAKEGDTLITVKGSGVGELWHLSLPSVAMGRQLMAVRSVDAVSGFVFQFLITRRRRFEDLAAGNLIPGLSRGDILDLEAPFPLHPEQQKIAECLSSVDEVIAAQARQVDALKTHKKWLMQQLFPREGETQPRLRFPQFRNQGEWEETRLSQLGGLIPGLTYSPDDLRESGLLVLRSSNIQNGELALDDNVYVNPAIKGANLSKPNDILVCVRNGSKALIGKSALVPEGMPLCTHGAFMTVFRAQAPRFVFQLFQTTRYYKQVAGDLGATINSINGSQFLKYTFFVPKPPEQQRIAVCLSSLDSLITAETKKLEALKRHKRGLMQQLFPSPEETEG